MIRLELILFQYDVVQGPFDFVSVVEGDAEQAIAMKGVASMSGDFDQVHLCTSVSLDTIRNNVKKIISAYILHLLDNTPDAEAVTVKGATFASQALNHYFNT